MSKNARMAQWLDYRVRINVSDGRIMLGTFLAFDKFMNVVLADTEEFRRIRLKSGDEKEVKRNMGLIILRGEQIISLTAEAPPAQQAKKAELPQGPGKGQVAGRGMPVAPLSAAPAGLGGAIRGIGGPAPSQMTPKAPAGRAPAPPSLPPPSGAAVRPPSGMPPKTSVPRPPM